MFNKKETKKNRKDVVFVSNLRKYSALRHVVEQSRDYLLFCEPSHKSQLLVALTSTRCLHLIKLCRSSGIMPVVVRRPLKSTKIHRSVFQSECHGTVFWYFFPPHMLIQYPGNKKPARPQFALERLISKKETRPHKAARS